MFQLRIAMPSICNPRPFLRPPSVAFAAFVGGFDLGRPSRFCRTSSPPRTGRRQRPPGRALAPEPSEPADVEAVPPEVQSEEPEGESPARGMFRIPCENVQHPYQAELCQQWRTARAAEETARASRRTLALSRLLMLIGAVATALLLLMFIPLLAAAFAARRAASRRAARHRRRKAVKRRELRAYVDVDRLEFIETPESEGVVKVRIDLRNSGQTPALRLKSAAEVGVRDVADEDLLPVMTLPGRSSLDPARPRLGRDAIATQIVSCESPPKLADRVTNGEATILVWGFVEYSDVFDRTSTGRRFSISATPTPWKPDRSSSR